MIVDVNHDMELMREETFGPVLPIMRVRDEEEAIRLANDTRYGLQRERLDPGQAEGLRDRRSASRPAASA